MSDKPEEEERGPGVNNAGGMYPMQIEVPSTMGDPATYQKFSAYQLIYSICGLILGLACVLGGIVLFLHGVTGSTSWTAKMVGAESQISDAAPGAVLFIVGLFVVLITRFTIKVRK
jgi:nitrate reductase gamma subunit